jgi:hypothetical protein
MPGPVATSCWLCYPSQTMPIDGHSLHRSSLNVIGTFCISHLLCPTLARSRSTLPSPASGDLIVSCAQTRLTASLKLAKDSSVQGVLEQSEPAAPSTGGKGRMSAGAAAAAGLLPGTGATRQLGVLGGSWRNQVYVSCPGLVGGGSKVWGGGPVWGFLLL